MSGERFCVVRVAEDNPGQFFACCGLLELADRLWGGAEGWFEGGEFRIRRVGSAGAPETHDLGTLLSRFRAAELVQLDAGDETASPLHLGPPFDLRLDWWKDTRGGGAALKTWAGRMSSVRIARAMQAVACSATDPSRALDAAAVAFDVLDPTTKVEPFYFDARRGANARAVDIGFMPDALQMTAQAFPAVEVLSLVGLQRCRPTEVERRSFEYSAWTEPVDATLGAAAASGLPVGGLARRYRFDVEFRTDQRKHKAFAPAVRLAP